ncbi:MAG: flagellar biosynthesis protein FlhB [Alicyclobacillus mali]|uniref:flagellar biosynthesis protein FlhB n=1 Tax=Alicyclobacillus mali (ex Roth et al. 2021) TaxID=1123961 RepID=UPI00082D4F4B|nr:flagellar biosynthesis protein FlhB [Alicyclobacillus mali (ex Roth et al. 2021)]MCL6488125.1 flagellar biosynthesis protein FlhB [Alicyclobacillus mali (ex Roth et al. 2021)]
MRTLQLQRFAAGERTERATPRRRQEARKEGRVARSPELTSAVAFAAVLVALRVLGPDVWGEWENLIQRDLGGSGLKSWTVEGVRALMATQVMAAARIMVPIAAVAIVVGLAAAVMQVRPMFVPQLLLPDFQRISPATGLRRIASLQGALEALKSLLKLAAVAGVAYTSLASLSHELVNLSSVQLQAIPGLIGRSVFNLAIRVACAMVVIAALDYAYQRYSLERSLRMSKQELKDELKETEGNPLLKSAVRRRARQIASRRMMQNVAKADVVITNPTHYAVALAYQSETMNAPQVVAKGADFVAQEIRRRAEEHEVPLVENPPLAQALYRTVDVGQEIPPDLYQAVAEVLAYVYRMRAKGRR